MQISKELFLAILSMDAYNRGYNEGISGLGSEGDRIGTALITQQSDVLAGSQGVSTGFYALSYNIEDGSQITGLDTGDTVISFRGTDNLNPFDVANDIFNGWVSGAGFTTGQVPLAFEFYKSVTGNEYYEKTDNTVLTGHSLGGGLAGITAALSGVEGQLYDHSPYGIALR